MTTNTLCSMLHPKKSSIGSAINASLGSLTPASSVLLPVDLMRTEKSGLLMDAICVLFPLHPQSRSSSVSVVFDFNASLNDAAPVSPMLLPVDL